MSASDAVSYGLSSGGVHTTGRCSDVDDGDSQTLFRLDSEPLVQSRTENEGLQTLGEFRVSVRHGPVKVFGFNGGGDSLRLGDGLE